MKYLARILSSFCEASTEHIVRDFSVIPGLLVASSGVDDWYGYLLKGFFLYDGYRKRETEQNMLSNSTKVLESFPNKDSALF